MNRSQVRKLVLPMLVILAVPSALTAPAHAKTTHIDSRFGIRGFAKVPVPSERESSSLTAISGSGGHFVVAVGRSKSTITRFNSRGRPVRAFGGSGTVNLRSRVIGKPAITSRGELLIRTATTRILKLKANGSADKSFGDDGTLHVANANNKVPSDATILLQKKGFLFIANPDDVMAFRRNGELNTNFGDAGHIRPSFPVQSVSVAPTGRVIISGGFREYSIAKFSHLGGPVPSWGTDGVKTFKSMPDGAWRGSIGDPQDTTYPYNNWYEQVLAVEMSSEELMLTANTSGGSEISFAWGTRLTPTGDFDRQWSASGGRYLVNLTQGQEVDSDWISGWTMPMQSGRILTIATIEGGSFDQGYASFELDLLGKSGKSGGAGSRHFESRAINISDFALTDTSESVFVCGQRRGHAVAALIRLG